MIGRALLARVPFGGELERAARDRQLVDEGREAHRARTLTRPRPLGALALVSRLLCTDRSASASWTPTPGSCECSPRGSTASGGRTACSPRRCLPDALVAHAPRRAGDQTSRCSAPQGGRPGPARRARRSRTWASSSCTGPVERRPAGARAAARGGRLGDQAVPSGGGHRAGRGRRPPPPALRRPAAAATDRRRRARDSFRAVHRDRRRHAARTSRAASSSCWELLTAAEGQVLRARGDLRAGVGLRDGPRRPLGRRVRAQAAPEARAGSPDWRYIHTHFGIGYRFEAEPVAAPEPLAEPVTA